MVDNMRRVVLVTGGAGYVGSHAAKALAAAGFHPVTYDNLSTGNLWAVRWGPLERGDILDAARLNEVFEAHRPIGVLHFAALALVDESMRSPAPYYQVNVAGTVNLLEACRKHGIPAVVFSSTCAVYGTPKCIPITESMSTRPINPYGRSKLMVERILEDYEAAYGLRHIALRYFNAAGADSDGGLGEARRVETHLIPLALDAILGQHQPLKIYGVDFPTPDGTAVRDYVHVRDLAEAHVRALTSLLAGCPSCKINLGTGRGSSVREVLATVAAVTGRPVPHEIAARRPGDPPELVADPGKALAFLGHDVIQRSSLLEIVQSAWAWHTQSSWRGSAELTR